MSLLPPLLVAANGLSFALSNTPYINLFYTRPALDFLFLNSMREAASPGYLKRQEKVAASTASTPCPCWAIGGRSSDSH